MEKRMRILAAVDGSDVSDRVMDTAVTLAEAVGADLDILFVSYFDSTTDDEEEDSWLPESVAGPTSREVDAALKRAHIRVPDSICAAKHHKIGVPGDEILAFINDNHVDIAVLGGRGLGAIQGFLMGSVSQTVLESAPCGVVIVK